MPLAPKKFKPKNREKLQGTKQQRGYGGEWERISQIVRQAHPVCEYCHNAPSEEVDHIIPFKGPNDPLRTQRSNLKATCRACHQRKHNGVSS